MPLVTSKVRNERLDVCRACEHFVTATQTCGTLYLGKDVDGVQLCGCIMPVKTTLSIASCPLDKWEMTLSKQDVQELKELLGDLSGSKITGEQNRRMTELYNRMTGKRNKTSNCAPCVKRMKEELIEILKDE